MGKTYFEDIKEGRSVRGELVDPFRVIICGLDPESAEVAAQSEEAARIVDDLTMPSNVELKAYAANPNKFLESYAIEAVRLQMRGMLSKILSLGTTVGPITVRRVGKFYVADAGRHTLMTVRIARRIIAGEIHVKYVADQLQQLLAERGEIKNWPTLPALPPPLNAETNEAMAPAEVAAITNIVRPVTTAECFALAVRRIKTARTLGQKPNFAALAIDYRVSESTVRDWEKLATFSAEMQELVLVGGADGRKFPLKSAMELKGLPPEIMLARAQAMLAGNDTRSETARNTARAITDKAADTGSVAPRTSSAEPQTERRATRNDAPSESAAGASDASASEPKPSKTSTADGESSSGEGEEKKPSIVRGRWGARDYKSFVEKTTDEKLRESEEWQAFQVLAKLFLESPDKLLPSDFKKLGPLGPVLKKFINAGKK